MMYTLVLICASLVALSIGIVVGSGIATRSLVIGIDDPGRTAHCIGGRFVYVIPESEYVDLMLAKSIAESRPDPP